MDRFTIDDTDKPPNESVATYSVLSHPDERIPIAVKEAYIADLENRVGVLVGSEPKDFAQATILIYEILRLSGEHDKAREIGSLLDVPAMVLFQVPPLTRSIHEMGASATTAACDAALEQIDDLSRLVLMALDGNTDADIVLRLINLREAVSAIDGDPERFELATAAAGRLTNLVNAFFFDRLTAIPSLRTYVVGLELGL